MRFLQFTVPYADFAAQIEQRVAGERRPYSEIGARFIDHRLGLSHNYAPHLQARGHVAERFLANVQGLQRAWAAEHGMRFREDQWMQDILLAQVRAFDPDVVFLEDVFFFHHGLRQAIREQARRPVRLLGWLGVGFPDHRALRDLDLVLTCVPNLAEQLRRAGCRSAVVNWAFEPRLLEERPAAVERTRPFIFVGTLHNWPGYHGRRYGVVERLMNDTPLAVWGRIDGPRATGRIAEGLSDAVYASNRALAAVGVGAAVRERLPILRRGAHWVSSPRLGLLADRFPGRVHPARFGAEYYDLLAEAALVFNSHIDIAENFAGNLRLYEATGMGCCLLTDWKDNLPELFEPNVEVATYSSPDEAVEKARYLLDHPAAREALANAGQRRTLREHSYERRAERLLDLLSAG